MKSYSVTIQMIATEQFFSVVLFIVLCKVILSFDFVHKIQRWDHRNDSYTEQFFSSHY